MSYDSTRDSEQLRLIDASINDFVQRYNNSSVPLANRRTVILFPGGMGSKLMRATKPYVDNAPPQQFQYDTVWLTPETLIFNQALLLEMHQPQPGEYRDKDDQIIVADGSVELLGVGPYSGFTAWCDLTGIDWFIFGWDWRRPLHDAALFFVQIFLPHFRQRIINECNGADPLTNFSLIGHSFGGMVVNWILRDNAQSVANVNKVITVATPFYGYAGQVHRWSEGEKLLNGPFDIFKEEIKKVISSLPACYSLHFMDYATYLLNQAALAGDPNYPLATYPSRDKATQVVADPYNPQPNGNYVRYPPQGITGFNPVELANGANIVGHLCSLMPVNLAPKFFNLRGVLTANETIGTTTWDWLTPPQFKEEPIADVAIVPGDDTQPAWSARLVTLPAAQCIAVKGDHVHHMFLMNHPETLLVLGQLL
jgi:pimeloyl-ACP methyl ester carboxylesterase